MQLVGGMSRLQHMLAYTALAAVALFFLSLWVSEQKKAAAAAAIAQEHVKQDAAIAAAYRDSLSRSSAATDSARNAVHIAIASYETARAQLKPRFIVDTLKIPSDLPGSPRIELDSGLIVPPQFVHSADSLKTTCTALDISCAQERVRADSVITVQARELDDMQKLLAVKKGRGLLGRIEDWGIGAGVAFGICVVRP
jgi:hypothetical protein